MKRIVIIGGGLSGSLTALYLCQQKMDNFQIVIIEKSPSQLFKGLAYASDLQVQPLNVPASGMSLYINEPNHFYNWLQANGPKAGIEQSDITPDYFAPRQLFGTYLTENLNTQLQNCNAEIAIVHDEVINIQQEKDVYSISLDSGKTISCDKVVIASGNQDNHFPYPITNPVYINGNVITNPWQPAVLNNIPNEAPILIVGCGLTMVDVLINLRKNGHKGKLRIVSRHGLIPLPHKMGEHWDLQNKIPEKISVTSLIKYIKSEVKLAAAKNIGWQSVIDAIRPYLPQWWNSLSLNDRIRLMEHMKPYWEIHRHRIPASTYAYLQNEIKSGGVAIYGGKIKSLAANQNGIAAAIQLRKTSENISFDVQYLINCIGPLTNLKKSKHRLWQNLFEGEMADTDYFDLGVACTSKGNIINKSGLPDKNIFVIGNLRRGKEFESVAIREIRLQANDIAKQISQSFMETRRKSFFDWIID